MAILSLETVVLIFVTFYAVVSGFDPCMPDGGYSVLCSEGYSCGPGYHCDIMHVPQPGERCQTPAHPVGGCVRDPECGVEPARTVSCSQVKRCPRTHQCKPDTYTIPAKCIKKPGCVCPSLPAPGPLPTCEPLPECPMSPLPAQQRCEIVVTCGAGYYCDPPMYQPPSKCDMRPGYNCRCPPPPPPGPYPECLRLPMCTTKTPPPVRCENVRSCGSGFYCDPPMIHQPPECSIRPGERCECPPPPPPPLQPNCLPLPFCTTETPAPIPCENAVNCNADEYCQPALYQPRAVCNSGPGCVCPLIPPAHTPTCHLKPFCPTVPTPPRPCEEVKQCPRGERCEPAVFFPQVTCVEDPGCRCPPIPPVAPPTCVPLPPCDTLPGMARSCEDLIQCANGYHCEPKIFQLPPCCFEASNCTCPADPVSQKLQCVRDPCPRPVRPTIQCNSIVTCPRGFHCEPQIVPSSVSGCSQETQGFASAFGDDILIPGATPFASCVKD